MSSKKKPIIGAQPPTGKNPRIATDPSDFGSKCPAWRFGHLQTEGPWCWSEIDPAEWKTLHDKLRNVERTRWIDLEMGGSHNVEKHKLITKARNRLRELGLDDLDGLFSLRLAGTERIWGIREGNVLKVLWWDPHHEVCPSYKKHT